MLGKALRAAGGLAATGAALTYAAYRYERSKVPAGSELICSTTAPASPPVVLKRLSADNLMGGFDAYYLGGTWFYDQPLDAAKIKATLAEAVTKMPALAGRRSQAGIVLSNAGARFSAREGVEGSARDHIGTDAHVEPPRAGMCDIPSTCSGGEQPLFTVRVTNFRDGTSSIGIAAPHSLMDGGSYFEVVSALAAGHAKGSFKSVPVPDFDAAKVWEATSTIHDPAKEQTYWVPYRIFDWFHPLWALGMGRLDSMLPRAKVHLSLREIDTLRSRVISVLAAAGGKAPTVTTNEAISVAFFHMLSAEPKLFAPGAKGTIRMVINAQGKGAFSQVEHVAGNFSWMVPGYTSKPPKEMSALERAQFILGIGNQWRDDAAKHVREFVLFFRVQDITGYMWSGDGGFESVDNTLFINNQTVYPIAQIRFGAGALIGFQPWHSHQHMQIVACPGDGPRSRLAGGVDIYLPKMYSPLLGTPEFKQKLMSY